MVSVEQANDIVSYFSENLSECLSDLFVFFVLFLFCSFFRWFTLLFVLTYNLYFITNKSQFMIMIISIIFILIIFFN